MDSDVTLLLPSPNHIEIEKSITVPIFYMLLSFAGGGKKIHTNAYVCIYLYIYTYAYVNTYTHIYVQIHTRINIVNLNKDILCK